MPGSVQREISDARSGRLLRKYCSRSLNSGSATKARLPITSTANSGISPTMVRTRSGMVWPPSGRCSTS